MTMLITAPADAASRYEAEQMAQGLAPSLAGAVVVIDCKNFTLTTPSFGGQLLREILIDRCADRLQLRNASDRLRLLAEQIATQGDLSGRLVF